MSMCFSHTFFFLQNRSNFDAHFEGTGPEIWRQTDGKVDGFVAGAGEFEYSFVSSSFYVTDIQYHEPANGVELVTHPLHLHIHTDKSPPFLTFHALRHFFVP